MSFVARLDAWVNEVLGTGTDRDKAAYGRFFTTPDIPDDTLESLYNSDDMAQIVVATVPEEIFRQGVTVNHKRQKEILEKARSLRALNKLQEAMIWGRLFGGGVLVLGLDDGIEDLSQPLHEDCVTAFDYLDVYDKRQVQPVEWYADRAHPKYRLPAIFEIHDESGAPSFRIHETRCIIFGGAHTTNRKKRERRGWDLSVLQRSYPAIRQFNSAYSALEHLLLDASVGVYKLKGLSGLIGAQKGQEALAKRASILDLWRNITRSILLDADGSETYERVSSTYSGIEQLVIQFVNRVAASSRYPATVLMGTSPAGLNATGASDIRNFYDRLRTDQTQVQPDVARVLNWCRKVTATDPNEPEVTIAFPSLWQESPKEKAEREKLEADKDSIDITHGVLLPEESTRRRYANDPHVNLAVRPLPPPAMTPAEPFAGFGA